MAFTIADGQYHRIHALKGHISTFLARRPHDVRKAEATRRRGRQFAHFPMATHKPTASPPANCT